MCVFLGWSRKAAPFLLGHQGNIPVCYLGAQPHTPPSCLLFSILLRVELFDDLEELGIPSIQVFI